MFLAPQQNAWTPAASLSPSPSSRLQPVPVSPGVTHFQELARPAQGPCYLRCIALLQGLVCPRKPLLQQAPHPLSSTPPCWGSAQCHGQSFTPDFGLPTGLLDVMPKAPLAAAVRITYLSPPSPRSSESTFPQLSSVLISHMLRSSLSTSLTSLTSPNSPYDSSVTSV